MKAFKHGVILLTVVLSLLIPTQRVSAAGPVSLNALGTPYTQNFDTLASSGTSSTLPNGWYFYESGTSANTTYTASTGSGTAGDTYSFGAASSSERAFGMLRSGSLISTIGAQFVNNTGETIRQLTISYYGEQWRLGATTTPVRQDRIDFAISTDATSLTTGTWIDFDALDFSTPNTTGTGAKDGNASANRTDIQGTVSGLAIPDGSNFWIRWTDDDVDPGSDDGLAVDDFSLTPFSYPAVSSITRAGVSPTSAASVDFTVTFSTAVTGVDTLDFSLTTTGISGASVTSVSGSGATYNVTVNSGSGSGTLRLDLIDNDTISDGYVKLGGLGDNNGDFTSGEVYTFDRIPPTVVSSVRLNTNPTSLAQVGFEVTFSKPVAGVDLSDFAPNAPDLTGASVASVSGSGTTYTVLTSTGTGSGSLRLDVIDDDSIVDSLGNPLGGVGADNGDFLAGQAYAVRPVSASGDDGLIVNELSNGSEGNREWMELVVVGAGPTVNLSGWIVDDNNGDFDSLAAGKGIATGHVRFATAMPACPSGQPLSAAPVGARIVIYNGDDTEGVLSGYPNDPCDANGDGVYYLPVGTNHSTTVLEQCSTTPGLPNLPDYAGCAYASPAADWDTVLFANLGDAVQTRRPDGSFFHGFAYGNLTVPPAPGFPNGSPSFNVAIGTSAQRAYQFSCGNYFSNAANQFTRINWGNAIAGSANTMTNAVLIRALQLGTFDFAQLNGIGNCQIEPAVSLSLSQAAITVGEPVTLTVTLRNPYLTLDGFSLDLSGVSFVHALPTGLTLASATPISNTCGGNFLGVTGGNGFSLSSVVLASSAGPAASACELVLALNAPAAGEYTLTQPAGTVLSAPLDVSGGANINAASVTLTVTESDLPDDELPTVGDELPSTGYAPHTITPLPQQPAESQYASAGLWLEIPRLGLNIPIVGVPVTDAGWDVTWLGNQAGWLAGTSFPSLPGNAAITAHVTNALGLPGPFEKLHQLRWGDRVIVHSNGLAFTFEVRNSQTVRPTDLRSLSSAENYAWLNLITCKNFDEATGAYANRLIVRAVLIEIE